MYFFLFCVVAVIVLATILARARWTAVKRYVDFTRDKVEPVALGPWDYARYEFGDFSGLGDEPVWRGNLPYRVEDFNNPRYVYEDLFESETPVENHGMVIGYRISPTLVIHSMVGVNRCWGYTEAKAFAYKYNGRFLEREEVNTLRRNWAKVSAMRVAIGDGALPTAWFWAKEDASELEPAHYRSRRWFPPEKCNVIMKR